MCSKKKIVSGVCVVIVGIITLIVIMTFLDNKTYVVSFNTDGGNNVLNQIIKKNQRIYRPSDPIKDGYIFVGWEYQGEEFDFTTRVKRNMTLKAIWEKDEASTQKYKITFIVNDNTKTIETDEINELDILNLGFEAKSGYVLKWYVDGKEFDLKEKIKSDLTIEGKYVMITTYTVKFNSNGGTVLDSQIVNVGEKAKKPEIIEKYGYVFEGWYLNDVKYDFDTPVTFDIILVAKWSEDLNIKRYNVNFDSDGGSSVPSQKVMENKMVIQPKNPTKKGYSFEGWYLNNRKYNFNSKVTSNLTLVAKWHKLAYYTVTFDSDGGNTVIIQQVMEGKMVMKPKNPTKNGYNFKEWQLNGKAYDFNSIVSGNLTLVAKWTQKLYTIEVSRVDAYSPDSILSVYEEDKKIMVKAILLNDGTQLCSGDNTTVNTADIEGESSFIVVLNDGTRVGATLR